MKNISEATPLGTPVQFADTPRGRLAYRDTGTGIALVMLHGWPQSSYCWEELLPHLPQYRLIRPDNTGLGDSDRPLERTRYAKQALAQDIIALMDTLQLDKFVLIGHDWGGVIAQEIALAQPDRVRGLVLINISLINNARANKEVREALKQRGYTYNWYQTFQQQEQLPEALITGNEELWLRHFLRMANKRQFKDSTVQEYVRTFQIPYTAATSANYYRTMAIDLPRWEQLGTQKVKFAMPGLYIHGYKDAVIIPEYSFYLEEVFEASVQLLRLDAGHFVPEELPQECATAIRQFVEALP